LLELIAAEIRVAMALTGCTRISEIDRHVLVADQVQKTEEEKR